MARIKILDCTLRDGGYINKWNFGKKEVCRIINDLTQAGLDYVEIGYLNKDADDEDKSIFRTIPAASGIIPKNRKDTLFLAMADVDQFLPENIEPYKKGYIDGIRVVFYKHQIEKALVLCRKVVEMGYRLFVQPMVTIDYSESMFADLINSIAKLNPFAVAIVDSFGCMTKSDIKQYFDILHRCLNSNVVIGFHSHNNMQLSLLNAESLFVYTQERIIVIDASLYGMGRGAGNLNTELIVNYYNENVMQKYDLRIVLRLLGDVIYPIYQQYRWGYTPYYFLTALYRSHPNYAAFLLEEKMVSVNEFEEYLRQLPSDMRLKCRKPYVLELYESLNKK